MSEPLPPIPDESLDGYKEEAAIHRDQPLPRTCDHSMVKFVGNNLQCGCGAGWTGTNLTDLYNLLHKAS